MDLKKEVDEINTVNNSVIRNICETYDKLVVQPKIKQLKEDFDAKLYSLQNTLNLSIQEIKIELEKIKENGNITLNSSVKIEGDILGNGLNMEDFVDKMSEILVKTSKDLFGNK